MTFPIVRSLAVTAVAMLLAACGDEGPISTGPLRTETRTVGDFDSIDVNGATRLTVTVGVPASLEVEGRDPFLSRLQTEVHGDTLHIRIQRKDWIGIGTSPRLNVRIGVPKLEDLEIQGGNDVRLSGFNGGEARIRLQGATNLIAAGRLDELRISMAGAGHADLGDLVTGKADVTVSGVGSVFVHPTQKLDATMNGVGAIFYTGTPSDVNTRMNGLGTIGQRSPSEARRERDKQAPIDPDSLQPEYERKPAVEQSDEPMTEVI